MRGQLDTTAVRHKMSQVCIYTWDNNNPRWRNLTGLVCLVFTLMLRRESTVWFPVPGNLNSDQSSSWSETGSTTTQKQRVNGRKVPHTADLNGSRGPTGRADMKPEALGTKAPARSSGVMWVSTATYTRPIREGGLAASRWSLLSPNCV